MTAPCTSCGAELKPNPRRKGTRCRRCVAAAMSKDPTVRAKRAERSRIWWSRKENRRALGAKISAAWQRRLQDPEKREEARQMGMRLQEPANRAKGDRKRDRLKMIPPEYRDEYRRLTRNHFRPAEARRMIREQILAVQRRGTGDAAALQAAGNRLVEACRAVLAGEAVS